MIKRFHEAPKCIFHKVQAMTDGDYALVNLFPEDEEYYNLFVDAIAKGREVILDNSVFELGATFDPDAFAGWVEKLKPTYYIVPDVLEDGPATAAMFHDFIKKYKDLPGKIIGVVQGKNLEEFIECYKAIEPYCDKVGISFDCSWYARNVENENYWASLSVGRFATLATMHKYGIINTNKPHHLLGVALPQEMYLYSYLQRCGTHAWIDSVDTSNPVVHGLKGIAYRVGGLDNKETQKLYTMINSQVDEQQWETIEHNIRMFREFTNG